MAKLTEDRTNITTRTDIFSLLKTYCCEQYNLTNCELIDATENVILGQCLKSFGREEFPWADKVIAISLFAAMITFGTIGSALIIFAVMRNPKMRTSRNIVIANLAVGDLILCLFTQPLGVYKLIGFIMSDATCKVADFSQSVNLFVSTLSITAIALDRFQVVICHTQIKSQKFFVRLLIMSIWLLAIFMALPMAFFRTSKSSKIDMKIYCSLENEYQIYYRNYFISVLIGVYCVPAIVMISSYMRICLKMKTREKKTKRTLEVVSELPKNENSQIRPGDEASEINRNLKSLSNRKTTRTRRLNLLLLLVVTIFVISWLPLHLWNLLSEIYLSESQETQSIRLLTWIQLFCMLLVLLSSCLNPILYGWWNKNFRDEFLKIIPNKLKGHRRTQIPDSSLPLNQNLQKSFNQPNGL